MVLELIYLTPVFHTSASYSEIFIHVFSKLLSVFFYMLSTEAEPDHYYEMLS